MEALLAIAGTFYLIGLLQGFWARAVYDWGRRLYFMFKDRIETPPGVVKPIVTRGPTRGQGEPIDLTVKDEPGISMRPTPLQVAIQRGKDQ